jgi:hypothetical protein
MRELKNTKKELYLNNNSKNSIQHIFAAIIFLILLISCNPIIKTIGPFSSYNIEASKKAGVFLWEYYPLNVKNSDTIKLEMKEVFAEKQYSYFSYKDLRYNISKNKFQVIIVDKDIVDNLGYNTSWTLENFGESSPYGLEKEYIKSTPPDTFVVKILKVDIDKNGGAGKDDGKVIGSFTLRRKR